MNLYGGRALKKIEILSSPPKKKKKKERERETERERERGKKDS